MSRNVVVGSNLKSLISGLRNGPLTFQQVFDAARDDGNSPEDVASVIIKECERCRQIEERDRKALEIMSNARFEILPPME